MVIEKVEYMSQCFCKNVQGYWWDLSALTLQFFNEIMLTYTEIVLWTFIIYA